MERQISKEVQGFRTQDGAGVKLVRVLSNETVDEYDPLLMLDSFDSDNPDDYRAGFPRHPHRGIETISYLWKGEMTHKDTMGNEDTITDGEVQWMTSGSGIEHSETLPSQDGMLGVQLWLNLPKKDKMTKPHYQAIKRDEIEEIEIDGGMIRLLAGSYDGYQGYQADYLPLDYYDIHLEKGAKVKIDTDPNRSITLFTLLGDAKISGKEVEEKTAVKLTEGDYVTIEGLSDETFVLFMSSERLDEPVAWAGPIVMNTRDELRQASLDLRMGTFIKDEIEFDTSQK